MWSFFRENPRAVVYAIVMHLALLVLLVTSLDWTPKVSREAGQTPPIQAKLVDHRQLEAIEERKQAELEAIRKAEAEKQRKAEAEKQRKAEAEKQRKAEAEKQRKAEAEKQRKAEAEKQRKAEAEKQRKAEAEKKRKAEAEKKRKAEAARRREAEQALQAQLSAEQERLQAERAQGVVSEYTAYIQDKIQRNWLRPPGSPAGLSCVVQVSLIPGGDVARVAIVRSSGDPLFDRSVETAVYKAAPLPLPSDASMFKHFRELRLIFKPT